MKIGELIACSLTPLAFRCGYIEIMPNLMAQLGFFLNIENVVV